MQMEDCVKQSIQIYKANSGKGKHLESFKLHSSVSKPLQSSGHKCQWS